MEKLADISIFNSLTRACPSVYNKEGDSDKQRIKDIERDLKRLTKGKNITDYNGNPLSESVRKRRIEELKRERERLLQKTNKSLPYKIGSFGGSAIRGTSAAIKGTKDLAKLLKSMAITGVQDTKTGLKKKLKDLLDGYDSGVNGR